jgi:hypothetical protein
MCHWSLLPNSICDDTQYGFKFEERAWRAIRWTRDEVVSVRTTSPEDNLLVRGKISIITTIGLLEERLDRRRRTTHLCL